MLVLLLLSGCALLNERAGSSLKFSSLVPDKDGPRAARSTTIRWTVSATGGAGQRSYEFRILTGFVEVVEQRGPCPTWHWNPKTPGRFQVRAIVKDGTGASVDSGWSSPYVITPPVDKGSLIAVLPVDNLSGSKAPLEMIERSLRIAMSQLGLSILDDEALRAFMRRYRVRYTGGLSSQVSRAIAAETAADAFLVTSLEGYQDTRTPKIALVSRLVLAGEEPEIAWMDDVGLSGDDSVGLLGIGRVRDPEVLLERAVRYLADSLARYLPEATEADRVAQLPQDGDRDGVCESDDICQLGAPGCGPEADASALPTSRLGKHHPRTFYRSPILNASSRYTLAVIPFLNLSERKNAGKILTLHFVNQLLRSANFTVVEPGLVREQLLKYRIIMAAGPSLANADIISSQGSLGVDLVLSGTVFDYQDAVGIPKVDFSVKIIEKRSREVVWSSRSYNHGEQGVFFFDFGRVHTAHRLASEMARRTLEVMTR